MKNIFKPFFILLTATILWGFTPIFVKLIDLSATSLSFYRSVIPLFISLCVLFFRPFKLFKEKPQIVLVIAILDGARVWLYFSGIKLTSVSLGMILLYSWPIFFSVLATIFFREKITIKKASLLLLGFIGIFLANYLDLSQLSTEDILGGASMISCAILTAIQILLMKKLVSKYSIPELIFSQNIIGSIIFAPAGYLSISQLTMNMIMIILLFSILIGYLSWHLYYSQLNKLPSSTIGVISYNEAIVAIIFSAIIFSEKLSINIICGGSLILLSGLSILLTDFNNAKVVLKKT